MSKNRYDDYDDYDFEETPSRRRSRNSGRRKKKEKKSTKVGLEPTTFRLEVCCAAIAPLGLYKSFLITLLSKP